MTALASLTYAPEVVATQAAQGLAQIEAAAQGAGVAIEQADQRITRTNRTFDDLARSLSPMDRAMQNIERATARVTERMTQAEEAARREGVSQERLATILAQGARARELAAERAVQGLSREERATALAAAGYQRLADQMQSVVAPAAAVAAANDNAVNRMDKLRSGLGQASFQIQDLATQISMGGDALNAFGVQGAQLLGAFGPTGAIAGAVLMVGTLAAKFLGTGDAADEARQRGQTALDAMSASAKVTAQTLQQVNDLFLTAAERAANLANIQRGELRLRSQNRLEEISAGRQELARRLADEEQYLGDINRPNGPYYRAESDADRDREARAIVTVRTLRSEMQAADREAGQLRDALGRLDRAGVVGTEQFGPDAPRVSPGSVDDIRGLDKAAQAREQYAARVNVINSALARGEIEQAEATRLTRLAEDDRNDALKKLTDSSTRMTAAQREANRELEAARRVQAELYSDATLNPRTGLYSIGTFDDRLAERLKSGIDQRQAADKRASENSAREWKQANEKQERDAERTYERISDYAGNTFADLMTNQKSSWEQTWKSLEKTALATLAKLVFEAAARPIIMPIIGAVQGVFGGGSSSGGLFSIAGSSGNSIGSIAQATGGAASKTGYLEQAGSLSKLGGSLFGNGGPSILEPGYSFQGGMLSRVDGVLQTNVAGFLDTPVFTQQAPAFGPFSAADPTAAFTGNANTLTIGQAGLGALGVAGGAFGIYSGIQQGGLKGAANVVSGTAGIVGGAASLAAGSAGTLGLSAGATAALGSVAAVAPYVAAIAAVVAMLLPAQKPSDRTGTASLDLSDNSAEFGGLTGARYSEENRKAADQIGLQLQGVADKIGQTFGFNARGSLVVSVGDRDGIKLGDGSTEYRYDRDDDGIAKLVEQATRYTIAQNKDQFTGNLSTVINTLGTGSESKGLLDALQWTKDVYNVFDKALDPVKVTAYEQSIDALNQSYADAIDKATKYGLSLKPITSAKDEQLAALEKARSASYANILQGFDVTAAGLRGDDMTSVSLKQFDLQRASGLTTLQQQIKDLGYGSTETAKAEAGYNAVQDMQRLALERQTTRAFEDREASKGAINDNLRLSYLQATKDPEAEIAGYAVQRFGEWRTMQRALEDTNASFGEIAESSRIFNQVTQLNIDAMRAKTQAEKDAAAAQEAATKRQNELDSLGKQQSALSRVSSVQGTLVDYINGLSVSGASPQNAFLSAQQGFADELSKARAAGIGGVDIGRVTGAADTLLSAGSALLGDGAQGAFFRQSVTGQLRGLGASLDLPAFGGSLDRVVSALNPLTDEVAALRGEVTRLRDELVTTRLRAA
ncbi:hypothetical protein [Roseomonas indoligenes]|uniref:Bacteriophage tail tape measure N-terminal domain-containing protein n=1 Tax=Roseomonas indoligenes TaxID=2820811 RepID=A0A940MXK7_9PROT|nr:hypothetical protein [Pararoseomonas indoligenes]MBP0493037.1 hypothetical protein [Pararoseomonas indoligenes]